jgi:hypothetical protein
VLERCNPLINAWGGALVQMVVDVVVVMQIMVVVESLYAS